MTWKDLILHLELINKTISQYMFRGNWLVVVKCFIMYEIAHIDHYTKVQRC